MPGAAGERLGRAEHLVEGRRDVAAVHAPGRALVGRAEGGAATDDVAVEPELDRRRQRVGPSEHRAVVEEPERRRRRWPPRRSPRRSTCSVVGEPSAAASTSAAAASMTSLGALVCTMRCSTTGSRRRRGTGRLAEAVGSVAASASMAGGPSGRRPGCRRLGRLAHATSSNSTTNGAWSEGCLPLRALRSMSAHGTRSASGAEPRTRSMRIPMPLWKLPAR